MACRLAGIRLRTQVHPGQHKYTSRCTVKTPRSRSRQRRQSRGNNDTPYTMQRTGTRGNPRQGRRKTKADSQGVSRRAYSRTSRERRNNPSCTAKNLSMARNDNLDRRIRQRMCGLPGKQEPHPSKENSPVPHPYRTTGEALHPSCYGFDHQPTQEGTIQCHPNHHGPWLLKSSSISIMQ